MYLNKNKNMITFQLIVIILYSLFTTLNSSLSVSAQTTKGVYSTGLITVPNTTFDKLDKSEISLYSKNNLGDTTSMTHTDGSDPAYPGGFSKGRVLKYFENNEQYLDDNPVSTSEYFKLTAAQTTNRAGSANFNYLIDVSEDFTFEVGLLQYASRDEISELVIADGYAINFFSGDRSSIGTVGGKVGSDFKGNEALLFRNYGSSKIGVSDGGSGVAKSHNYNGTTFQTIIQNRDVDGKSLLAPHSKNGQLPNTHGNYPTVGIYEKVTLRYDSLSNRMYYRVTAIDQGCEVIIGCEKNDVNDSGEQVVTSFFNNQQQPNGAGSSYRYLSISASSGAISSAKYVTNVKFTGSVSKTVASTVDDIDGNGVLNDGEIVSYEVGAFNGDSHDIYATVSANDSLNGATSMIDSTYGEMNSGVILAQMQSLNVDVKPSIYNGVDISKNVSFDSFFSGNGLSLKVPVLQQTVARVHFKTLTSQQMFDNPTAQYSADGYWHTDVAISSPNSASVTSPFVDVTSLKIPYENQEKNVKVTANNTNISQTIFYSQTELYQALNIKISDDKFKEITSTQFSKSSRVTILDEQGEKLAYPLEINNTTNFKITYFAGTVGENITLEDNIGATIFIAPKLILDEHQFFVNAGEDINISGLFNDNTIGEVNLKMIYQDKTVLLDTFANPNPGMNTTFNTKITNITNGRHLMIIYLENSNSFSSNQESVEVNVRSLVNQSMPIYLDGIKSMQGGFSFNNELNDNFEYSKDSTFISANVLENTKVNLTTNDLTSKGYIFDGWIDVGGRDFGEVPEEILNNKSGIVSFNMTNHNINLATKYKLIDQTKGNILVKVYKNNETSLLTSGLVKLIELETNQQINGLTNEHGEVLFSQINPGKYLIVAHNAASYIYVKSNATASVELVVDEHITTENTGFIYGKTLDASTLESLNDVNIQSNNNSDEFGDYVITGLSLHNESEIIASKDGYENVTNQFLATSSGLKKNITLIPSATLHKSNLYVKVLDQNQSSVANAKVKIVNVETGEIDSKTTLSDGTVLFKDLAISNFIIIVNDGFYTNDTIVKTEANTVTNTFITLNKLYHGEEFIYGKVVEYNTNIPIDNAKITVDNDGSFALRKIKGEVVYSNIDGIYALTNLSNANHTINVTKENYIAKQLNSYSNINGEVLDFKLVKEASEGYANLIVSVEANQMLDQVVVELKNWESGVTLSNTLDDNGVVVFDNVEYGKYILNSFNTKLYNLVVVEVSETQNIYVDVTLDEIYNGSGFIYGRVFDFNTNQGVARASVELNDLKTYTNDYGEYIIGNLVEDEQYIIVVGADNYHSSIDSVSPLAVNYKYDVTLVNNLVSNESTMVLTKTGNSSKLYAVLLVLLLLYCIKKVAN